MSAFRQFLLGVLAGAIVIALIVGSVLLSAGDLSIAFRPSPTAPEATEPNPTPATPLDTLTPTVTPTLVPAGACPRPAGWIDHVVSAGEDLAAIAAQYQIDAALLQAYNCLIEPVIEPGQVIFVPPPPTATPTIQPVFTPIPTVCGPRLGWTIYIVQRGDTLASIARATGATVFELMLANCLDTDRIYAGQRLFVPRLPFPTPTRTPFPSPTPLPSLTPSPTDTAIAPTPTPTPSLPPPLPTDTPTVTPTGTPTDTPTPIVIASPTPTPTVDQPPTATDTLPPTDTLVPTP
ncbi:MAG TPA: LysM peptidoglycan-binding domain-containing protein [Anaerolineae bacterium]|nr:LysM peptidoglycan-binding domain-containing protein [Anaerolineae bacterium]